MVTKHILLGATLLILVFALHALTEEDIATLDAAFEATFREGPTCGINVWVDPAKVPTNYTEWAYALTTREGCLGRFRRHLPQGVTYSDDEICEAFPLCLQRRCAAQIASTNKWTTAWEREEGIVDHMFFLCENALASTNNIPMMEVIGASTSETNAMYKSDAFSSIWAALGMTDECTRYLCASLGKGYRSSRYLWLYSGLHQRLRQRNEQRRRKCRGDVQSAYMAGAILDPPRRHARGGGGSWVQEQLRARGIRVEQA